MQPHFLLNITLHVQQLDVFAFIIIACLVTDLIPIPEFTFDDLHNIIIVTNNLRFEATLKIPRTVINA